MPLVQVHLSAKLNPDSQATLMKTLSQSVAKGLGKPESYMMVVLRSETPVLMGGRPDPAALVEVRSVGTISSAQAHEVAGAVSSALAKVAGLDAQRVYCVMSGVPGALWAQGSETFG